MKKVVEAYIDAHRDDIIADWKELVNMEGSLREPELMYGVAEHLKGKFEAAGLKCKIHAAKPEVPPVLTGVIGEDRPGTPILFGGHFDTVFDKGTYGENPFRIEGEKAFGPGVLDMKGGIIISLWVIKALEEAGFNDRPIRIVYCGDEEGGPEHNYAEDVILEAAKGCLVAFNMETGPVNNNLCVGRKWVMGFNATFHGVASHSGNNYEVGRNALVEASHAVLEIYNMNDLEKGTNMNPAIVHAGKMHNQIPDVATLVGSGRFSSKDEIERVREAMTNLFETPYIDGVTCEYQINRPLGGFEASEKNLALWQFVAGECKAMGVPEVGHVFLGGGSDACSIAEAGVPVLCSCGVRGEWNHTDREYAVVESMFERSKLWANVIIDIDNFKC